ncbi:RNase III [Candidatus Terasakiella magnetica]|uniref:Ribonuclease 3 n=1 Tax=Candidatus Terasakiella magnetica TaxID=1867952 RepID=A0A1C3RCU1_9PROT|nr:ribonuclease III [Candidatus Terasakiella magnetica]SCA55095.1 RNase III [Candidatus Terasakiella magnetica]
MRSPNQLEQTIGYKFEDKSRLKLALVHSSTHRRKKDGSAHDNERLEFLGDRVLGLVIADILLKRFPKDTEGDLARRHTALVRKEALARVSMNIELGQYIDMLEAEAALGGRENPAILANACEAVIAALFLDGGLSVAQDFITKFWAELILEDPTPPQDNKTALQEWAQGQGLPLPDYKIVTQTGPAHAPLFEIEVRVLNHPPQRAQGSSKRKAEQAAAGELLKVLLDQKK